MRFEGTVPIRASRARVWAFLTDPAQAAQCAPGLEQLELKDDAHFALTLRTGVGPVKGRFIFDVTWLERRSPEFAKVQARGKVPGSAVDMISSMTLAEADDSSTTMQWESEVKISGMIASVGARLLQGAAEKTTNELFDCIRQKLESPP
jgi:carbon monoxide dehydrogenase subunit G